VSTEKTTTEAPRGSVSLDITRRHETKIGMSKLQIYMVGLIVDDMQASLDFYRRLGVDAPEDTDSTHVEIEMAGGMMLFLDSNPGGWDPGFKPSSGTGEAGPYRTLLEFYLDTESKVEAKFEELVGYGYDGFRPPYPTGFGMTFAFVNDPDGNAILLSGDTAKS
jgi:catechol 2,3-dioxygenase-like lactoylglutathione lyase family enzyme